MKMIMLSVLLALIFVGCGCATSRTSTPTRPMSSEEIKQRAQNNRKEQEEQQLAKEWDDAREQIRKQLLQIDQEFQRTEEEREQVETQLPEPRRQGSISQLQALQSKGDRLAEEAKVLQMTAAWIALDGADEGEMREITRLLNKNTAELDRVTIQIEQLRNR